MKEFTPMEQLAEKLKERQQHALARHDEAEYHKGRYAAYTVALKMLTYHLTKEQAAIEEAFSQGQQDVGFDPDYENDNGGLNPIYETTPTEYFTNKYKSNGI